jgi:zinc protease
VKLELHCVETQLDNGLRVFAHEDFSVPLAAVSVWYHVGSRNEQPGRTGFAHLFEHLMFAGSGNVPAGRFDELLEAVGGVNNGSTSADRTNYWETVPAHALDLALYLESDRMGWLPPAVTQERLDAQRDVVMNERRQSYENRPYGLAWERLLAALYPPGHPYHWPVIGSMQDIAAATLDDVLAFFETYYAPGNATVAVAGAVRAEDAIERVRHWFDEIPARRAAPAVTAPALVPVGRRLRYEDTVQLPRLYLAWHSPATFAPGDAELDFAAHVLAHGKASRLYGTLVREREIAQDIDAFQHSGRMSSAFYVVATARPGVTLATLEAAIREEIERIASAGVRGAEVERARNVILTSFVGGLQTVGGFGGRADRLNLYAFHTGDPGWAARDAARYEAVDAAGVRDAVRNALLDAPGITLSVVPHGGSGLAAGGDEAIHD